MKLNIYNHKQIVKTYTADTYDLMFGTLEDIADAIKLDDMKDGSNNEIIEMAAKLVTKSMGTVRDLMKDVFPGITDEELRCTRVSDLVRVLVDVVKFTIVQLDKGASKN